MGREIGFRCAALFLLPLNLVFLCATSYAPCILSLELRNSELTARTFSGVGSSSLLLATAPQDADLPERPDWSYCDYRELKERWNIEELPEIQFRPVSNDPANNRYVADIEDLTIQPEREVLLIFFEFGKQEQDFVSDCAVITELVAKGRANPDRTVKKTVTDHSAAGWIMVGWLYFQGLKWLGIAALFAILVHFFKRRQGMAPRP